MKYFNENILIFIKNSGYNFHDFCHLITLFIATVKS